MPTPFETIPWLTRLLFAYDYLRAGGYAGFTAQERTDITNWFHNAGLVWDTVTVGSITANAMSDAFDDPPDFTCDQWACTDGPVGAVYYGGPTATGPQAVFNNRLSSAGAFSAVVGVFANDATLLAHGKTWMQANIRFGTYADGTVFDEIRWSDCDPPCERSAWGHASGTWSSLVGAADTVARTGDPSLYTFQSPGGLNGSGGGNVGLFEIMRHVARLANRTVLHYGTTDPGELTDQYLITWDSEGHSYWDFVMAVTNIYYQDPEIQTAVTRALQSGITVCTDGQYGCFNGLYINYPDIPFMFGELDEGQVDPYPDIIVTLAANEGVTFPSEPTGVSVTADPIVLALGNPVLVSASANSVVVFLTPATTVGVIADETPGFPGESANVSITLE